MATKPKLADDALKSPPVATAVAASERPPIKVTAEREAIWNRLEALFKQHFFQPDIEAAKVILACVAAHRIFEYPPAWSMAIAVAGSMKTVILESLDGLPDVYLIDEVTPQTFISGKIDPEGHQRKSPASLLHRIGNQGILISADFSTVLTSDQRNRAKVFSQLRRIYDGHLHREFGSDDNLEERDWKGRITFLAGVTPEVDRHHKVFSALGDRFIRTRWPRAGGVEAALRAMKHDRQLAVDVKTAVHELILPILAHSSIPAPDFPEVLFTRLANIGEFVACARAYVPRDRTDDIDGEAQVESNTRLPQELAQVGRGWAVLMNRSQVAEEDFKVIRRAAFDSIPPLRRDVLEAMMKGANPYSLGLPHSTVARTLGDLQASGLTRSVSSNQKGINGDAQHPRHLLTEKARSLLIAAGENVEHCAAFQGK